MKTHVSCSSDRFTMKRSADHPMGDEIPIEDIPTKEIRIATDKRSTYRARNSYHTQIFKRNEEKEMQKARRVNIGFCLTPIASAVVLALMGISSSVYAQEIAAPAAAAPRKSRHHPRPRKQLEEVVVSANKRIEKAGNTCRWPLRCWAMNSSRRKQRARFFPTSSISRPRCQLPTARRQPITASTCAASAPPRSASALKRMSPCLFDDIPVGMQVKGVPGHHGCFPHSRF